MIGQRGRQLIEPMFGTRCLRRHITAVVGIDWHLERNPAGNFNADLTCPHLVGETKPAAFLSQIENSAAAEVFVQRQSEPKLLPAVAVNRTRRQSGRRKCRRKGTALVKSGFPTTTTGLPPIASRPPTERVGLP